MPSTDWNALKEQTGTMFEPLPDGNYDLRLKTVQYTRSNNGKHMLKCSFEVVGNTPYAGRVVWNNFVWSPESPNSMSFFVQHMTILGVDVSQLPNDDDVAIPMLQQLLPIGQVVTATIGHQGPEGGQYAGRNQINAFSPYQANGAPAAPQAQTPPTPPPTPAPAPPTPAPTPPPAAPPQPATPAPQPPAPAPQAPPAPQQAADQSPPPGAPQVPF